jgi:predicted phosphodiesterase
MPSFRKKQMKEAYNPRWKLFSLVLASISVLSLIFGIAIFIGGSGAWWSSGYVLKVPYGLLRPLIYAFWVFLFLCLGLDIFFAVKLIKTRGKGHYRFAYVSAIALLVASSIAFFDLGGGSVPTKSSPLIVLSGANPSTTVVITCFTPNTQSNLVLEYNTIGSVGQFLAFDTGNENSHRFILDGLQPNTTYEYHLDVNASSTQLVLAGTDTPRYFKTAPSNATNSFSFLSISDIHSSLPDTLASRMASEKTDLLIEAGDLSDFGARSDLWDAYFATTSKLLASSNATAPVKLLLPVVGNHETFFFGKSSFDRYFHGVGNGPGAPYYYRVDAGNVHFIALDLEWGLESFSSDQEAWLTATLASINPSDWIIIVSHCPFLSSGDDGNVTGVAAKLAPVLQQHGVDLVISGHDHHYERIVNGNVTYMLTAAVHYRDTRLDLTPGSQAYIATKAMYARYVITGNHLAISGIDEDGNVLDSTTIYNR